MVARAVLDSLYRFVVPAVVGPSRLVPVAALASNQASVRALRVAAERGRLRAVKNEESQWRSAHAWVEEYLIARQH